jgi:hypothetical protein
MTQENNNNNNNNNNQNGPRPHNPNQRRGFHNRKPNHNRPQGQGGNQGRPERSEGLEGQRKPQSAAGGEGGAQQGQQRRDNRFHHGPKNNNRGPQQNHHRNRFNHRGPNHQQPRHDRPKPGSDTVYDRYIQLVQDYVNARKKYYEMFYRADDNQIRKIEEAYYKTIDALGTFEKNLDENKREQFLSKVDMYKFDTTYSENRKYVEGPQRGHHGLLPIAIDVENPGDGPFEDPHILQTQIKRASFKEDKEETVGTIEDYKKIKGL